jgi:hypothetical protein
MTTIRRKKEWSKEIISIEGKERLNHHNKYGWSFVDYL